MELKLVEKEKAIPILVEEEGFEGVRRIAAAVAEDIFLVTAKKPEVLNAEEIKKTGA